MWGICKVLGVCKHVPFQAFSDSPLGSLPPLPAAPSSSGLRYSSVGLAAARGATIMFHCNL